MLLVVDLTYSLARILCALSAPPRAWRPSALALLTCVRSALTFCLRTERNRPSREGLQWPPRGGHTGPTQLLNSCRLLVPPAVSLGPFPWPEGGAPGDLKVSFHPLTIKLRVGRRRRRPTHCTSMSPVLGAGAFPKLRINPGAPSGHSRINSQLCSVALAAGGPEGKDVIAGLKTCSTVCLDGKLQSLGHP